jgi:hypothetical protein
VALIQQPRGAHARSTRPDDPDLQVDGAIMEMAPEGQRFT